MERPASTDADESGTVMVTVAICTWNRSQLLAQTLERFCSIDLPAGVVWELLIVDNNSTDRTKSVVDDFAHRLPIRCVLEPQPGAACARNRALDEAACSTYVLFTDDDVLVDQSWLVAFVDAARQYPAAAGFAGPIDPWFPHEPDSELLDVFPALGLGFCGIDEASFLAKGRTSYTANLGFQMQMIRGIRFAEHLGPKVGFAGGGEDTAFCHAVLSRDHDIRWCPAMRVSHYVDPSRMTLSYLLRYQRDDARRIARVSGPPPGRSILGVPLWAVSLWAQSTVMHAWSVSRGQRKLALKHHRARAHWAGTIVEYFSWRRGSPA